MPVLKSITIDGQKFDLPEGGEATPQKTSTIVAFGSHQVYNLNFTSFDFLKLNSGQNLLNYIQNNSENAFVNLGWELQQGVGLTYSFGPRNDENSNWSRRGIWVVLAAALGFISDEDFFEIDPGSYGLVGGGPGIKVVPNNGSWYERIAKVGEIISLKIHTATTAANMWQQSGSYKWSEWYKGVNEDTLEEFLTHSSLYTAGSPNYVIVSFEVEKLL